MSEITIRRLLIVAAVLFGEPAGAQYTISTIAGGGPPNGVPATSISLTPEFVAVDSAGNLYLPTLYESRVYKISPSGTASVFAGSGGPGLIRGQESVPATTSQLSALGGVAVDRFGNVYIADRGNHRVRKVSPAGIISTVAGNGYPGGSGDGGYAVEASLMDPMGIAVDEAGSLYICEYGGHRVRKVIGQFIYTLAGNGAPGYSGDGGLATNAALNVPAGIAVDKSGNLYVADTGNNRLRKITPNGVISTVAGNGNPNRQDETGVQATSTAVSPHGVAIDPAGNILVSEPNAFRVRRISPAGIITTLTDGQFCCTPPEGVPSSSGSSIISPYGIACDASGNLYIAFGYRGILRKLSANGLITTIAGNGYIAHAGDGGAATNAQLIRPKGIAIDGSGSVYFAEPLNSRIRRISPSGILTTVAGTGLYGDSGDGGLATQAQLSQPFDIAIDTAGNLLIADTDNHRIRKVSPNGVITTVAGNGIQGSAGDGGDATKGRLKYPRGIATDVAGNLYISDNSNRVRKVSATGILTTIAGTGEAGYSGDGGLATSAQLNSPANLVLSPAGDIYIADQVNRRIRKVSPQGMITTVAGSGMLGSSGDYGLATTASFGVPAGLALDDAGNLFVTDSLYNRIRRIAPSGFIFPVAGNGGSGFSGDGGPSRDATLSEPSAIRVDRAGKIYFSDTNNIRIRTLTPVIAALPLALNFTHQLGTPPPAPQNIVISSTSPRIQSAVRGVPKWLSVSPVTTATPGAFAVSIDPANLTAGTYSAEVMLWNGDGDNTDVPVNLTVLASCLNGLSPFSFSAPYTGANSGFTITATSGCPWTVTADVPWILITSNLTGTGNAPLSYVVLPNSGQARRGIIHVGTLLTVTVTQAAAPGVLTGLRYVPVASCRVVDTRRTSRMNAGETRNFLLGSTYCTAPNFAAAYTLNVTAVPQSSLGYLTLWPAGQPRPVVSTLNSFDGRVKANAALVQAGAGGAVSVYVTDAADVVLDLNGYWVYADQGGDSFFAVQPCRVADTRLPDSQFGGPTLETYGPRSFAIPSSSCGIPASASAYSLNLTVVPLEPLPYLTAWPAGAYLPETSVLNSFNGGVNSNAAIIQAGQAGAISLLPRGRTDAVIDINGYFSARSAANELSFHPVTPCRVSDTRLAAGTFGGPILQAGETRSYPVTQSPCAIPSTARAYSLNATVVPQRVLSFLTIWPASSARPLVSTLNSLDGAVVSNAAIVPASATGGISVFVTDAAHLILDINGYFQ